jgi:non-ribosomal peptide synthetase component E (peptide arylation enzyme)
MLLWNRLKAHATTRGDKLALACGETRLTYGQFAAQAESVARAWLQQGLRPGDRIALHLRNGTELATGYYACFAERRARLCNAAGSEAGPES